MKANQMFFAGVRKFSIPAEKTNNHEVYNGNQLVAIYIDVYGNPKADNLSVRADVAQSFEGPGIYDVTIGFGSKPVVQEIKMVQKVTI